MALTTKEDLSIAYTPGVAHPCTEIAKDAQKAYDYTMKGRTIAVVTDGSAVLGLGNIGPQAALPVMEGKAVLFKAFADVDAFPICLNTQNTDEIVQAIELMAPGFGGINLEDIAAPRCFEIERKLQERLNIPVFHDDQHGTAIVVGAAVINAFKLKGQPLNSVKAVVNGAGAAGTAIHQMLQQIGVGDIAVCDREGLLESVNPNHYPVKRIPLAEVVQGRDLFIGVSAPNVLTSADVKNMAADPVVFAMANPVPEILPEQAIAGGAYIVGTGRSDFPNQINNVLVFPGLFRGVLNARARIISNEIKLAAVQALANCVQPNQLSPNYIIPDALDPQVPVAIASAVEMVAKSAQKSESEEVK
jgi:malate dehydrogenase (oxaloacetate-decarboxylating)